MDVMNRARRWRQTSPAPTPAAAADRRLQAALGEPFVMDLCEDQRMKTLAETADYVDARTGSRRRHRR